MAFGWMVGATQPRILNMHALYAVLNWSIWINGSKHSELLYEQNDGVAVGDNYGMEFFVKNFEKEVLKDP